MAKKPAGSEQVVMVGEMPPENDPLHTLDLSKTPLSARGGVVNDDEEGDGHADGIRRRSPNKGDDDAKRKFEEEEEDPEDGDADEEDAEEEEDSDEEEVSDDDDPDDDDDSDEAEARRQRNRERRQQKKRTRRQMRQRDKEYIRQLEQQNKLLDQRIAKLEQRGSESERAQIDQSIRQADTQIQQAEKALERAIERGDGKSAREASDMLYKARQTKDGLESYKKRMGQAPQSQPLDPVVQNRAQSWLSDHSWYDPQGADEDSAIVRMLDERVHAEGYDPRSQDYWDELSRRVARRLPHRFDDDEADDDDAPARRTGKRKSAARKPKLGGSGREGRSAGKNSFKLSPERIRAIKESGKWDDPAERQKAIDAYRRYDKEHGGA